MSGSWAQLEAEIWACGAEYTRKPDSSEVARDTQTAHCHCGQQIYPLQLFAEQLCEITFTKLQYIKHK